MSYSSLSTGAKRRSEASPTNRCRTVPTALLGLTYLVVIESGNWRWICRATDFRTVAYHSLTRPAKRPSVCRYNCRRTESCPTPLYPRHPRQDSIMPSSPPGSAWRGRRLVKDFWVLPERRLSHDRAVGIHTGRHHCLYVLVTEAGTTLQQSPQNLVHLVLILFPAGFSN